MTKNIDADVFREVVETRMIPDIKQKMPFMKGKYLFVQGDNCRVHIGKAKTGIHKGVPNRVISDKVCRRGGWEGMRMSSQPPQSPWFNVLDLAMFMSMEKEADQRDTVDSVEDLVGVLEELFWNYDPNKLEREFGTLAKVYKETLLLEGGDIKASQLHDSVRYRQVHGKDTVDLHLNAKMLAK